MTGFDPGAMASVLACLIEYAPPHSPSSAPLGVRIGALGHPSTTQRRAGASGDSAAFVAARRTLEEELRDLGRPLARCR